MKESPTLPTLNYAGPQTLSWIVRESSADALTFRSVPKPLWRDGTFVITFLAGGGISSWLILSALADAVDGDRNVWPHLAILLVVLFLCFIGAVRLATQFHPRWQLIFSTERVLIRGAAGKMKFDHSWALRDAAGLVLVRGAESTHSGLPAELQLAMRNGQHYVLLQAPSDDELADVATAVSERFGLPVVDRNS